MILIPRTPAETRAAKDELATLGFRRLLDIVYPEEGK